MHTQQLSTTRKKKSKIKTWLTQRKKSIRMKNWTFSLRIQNRLLYRRLSDNSHQLIIWSSTSWWKVIPKDSLRMRAEASLKTSCIRPIHDCGRSESKQITKFELRSPYPLPHLPVGPVFFYNYLVPLLLYRTDSICLQSYHVYRAAVEAAAVKFPQQKGLFLRSRVSQLCRLSLRSKSIPTSKQK